MKGCAWSAIHRRYASKLCWRMREALTMLSASSSVCFQELSGLQWRLRQRNSRISRQQPPTVAVKRRLTKW